MPSTGGHSSPALLSGVSAAEWALPTPSCAVWTGQRVLYCSAMETTTHPPNTWRGGSSPPPVATCVSLWQHWAPKVFEGLFNPHGRWESQGCSCWSHERWGWGSFLVMSSLKHLSHEGMETWEFAVLLSLGVIWAGVHKKLCSLPGSFYICKMILFSVLVPKSTA